MKNDNKGFSLIELIVVIAIMAILVGALAPQLIKYIEKSRVAADQQALGAVYTAVQTAVADPTVDNPTLPFSGAITTLPDAFKTEVAGTLGGDIANAAAALKSSKSGGSPKTINIAIDANGNVTVTAGAITVNASGSTVS